MTLDEAIKHEEEIVKEEQYEYQECVATHDTEGAMNCRKYAEEHRQLAEWLKDYKRLLEQEPCDDCIGREETKQFLYERIDRLNDDEFYDIFSKIIDDMYNELPPVTPQPKWILVSERLPEEHKEVLTCSLGGFIEIQSFEDSYDGYWENQNGDWSDIDEVLAWQPLPEPYKAESEVEE